MEEKIFAARLNSFKFIAYFILAFGFMLVINSLAGGFDKLSENSTTFVSGILTILAGLFFLRYSKKERKFIINAQGIEYHTSKPDYTVSWEELVLLKSYQEESKSTENLILMDKNENVLSVSTAFFEESKLKSAFRYIAGNIKDFENIKIEDDRSWLEE
jgi:hypothetical protein